MRGHFITATGTGVGKTLVTTILCHHLIQRGDAVRALKPVLSGFSPDDPSSDPALILQSLGQKATEQAIAAISPWRFHAPVSPHLAAKREGRALALGDVAAFCRDHDQSDCDVLLIEGAGGVMSPIDDSHTFLDLMAALAHPVILVTGTYLGAITHTLTAICALNSRGVRIRAVVVSESEVSAGLGETAESLKRLAGADLSLYTVPRIMAGPEPKWRVAGPLFDARSLLPEP
jgi:dethiobiotin synthetase